MVGLSFLFIPFQALSVATVTVQGTLVAGGCDVSLEGGGGVKMDDALASDFDVVQTASIQPFQMIINNCSNVKMGHSYSVSVAGQLLSGSNDVFNDDPTADLGFMLKTNGKGPVNDWSGTKAVFYNAAGTVQPDKPTQTDTFSEDDPLSIRLNYVVGLVALKSGTGAVNPSPRKVKATLTFNVNYQ